MNLMKTDWDLIERMIDKMLSDHMRTWDTYDYFVINDDTVLVKAYVGDRLAFTVKAKLLGETLEVVEVS